MTLQIAKVVVGVVVSVPDETVEHNVGYLPWVIGENLAAQVNSYVLEHHLGYYPALDFFRGRNETVDPALLELTDQIALFCTSLARREFRRRLSRSFSAVEVQRVQCIAFTMPRVRPSQSLPPRELARHYAPHRVKLELVVSSIQKDSTGDVRRHSMEKVARWAKEPFERLEVVNARVL